MASRLMRKVVSREFGHTRIIKATLAGMTLAAVCACSPAPSTHVARAQTTAAEDIFVLRTKRVETVQGAAPECGAAPFAARQTDVYQLYAMESDATTGLVTDAMAAPVHSFIACLGTFREDRTFDMFSIGDMDGGYSSMNTCAISAATEPAPGSLLIHCSGRMQTTPDGYSGGYMTSSTLAPTGGAEDVPGYTTTSIVTMRLWREVAD